MLILLTGASGFIGQHLVKELASRGHAVRALVRSDQNSLSPAQIVLWSLGQEPSSEILLNVDAIVHLAHDFSGEEGAQKTIKGTQTLFEQAQKLGVQKQILVSSYSAGPHAKSIYGRSKYELEQFFREKGGLIVRPGLVLGDGGITGRISRIARRWPIVPLPDGGRGALPIITVEVLVRLIAEIVEISNPLLESNLFEPKLISLRELVKREAAKVGRDPWIMPIPAKFILLGLALAEILNLRLPVTRDNLVGFLANRGAGHVSSLNSELEFVSEK